jgi:hypothetical protein
MVRVKRTRALSLPVALNRFYANTDSALPILVSLDVAQERTQARPNCGATCGAQM